MADQTPQDSGEKWNTQYTPRADAATALERAEKRAADEKKASGIQGWSTFQPGKMMLVWGMIGERTGSVTDPQWGTMSGATQPVGKVADACARLLRALD